MRRTAAELLRPAWLTAVALLAVLIAGGLYEPVAAQAPAREEKFVYATTSFDGLVYSSAMVLPENESIYMLADVKNILAPRRTLVYYWPITNRFLPDWGAKNELVEGVLEIYQNGELIHSVTLQDYVIQYDRDNPLETLNLAVGEEAFAAYAHYESLFEAYRDALFEHYEAQQRYREELDEIIRNNEPGQVDPEDLPVRPEPVADFTLLSTEPNKAYPIELPAGRYSLLMRGANGIPIPDSRKNLVVFGPERQGVAYSIVPQARWNRPEDSPHPESVIYTVTGSTLYLQPSRESLYNELYYSLMLDPQDRRARADRTMWVLHDPYPNTRLRILGNDGTAREINLQGYFVQQIPGSGLGYEVFEFDPESMERSSFEGFAVDMQFNNATYRIELLDENGQPIPGSRREIRTLNTDRDWQVYALGGLPILVGLGVFIARRRAVRRVRPPAGA